MGEAVEEAREVRLKRLRVRSWRRGTKEMDLLLGPYADERLAAMDPASLDRFEALLAEADTDLLAWAMGREAAPEAHRALIATIREEASRRRG